MWGYFFEFAFLLFICFLSYKVGSYLVSDFITGFIFLMFFTNFYFQGDIRSKGEIPIYFFNLFLYIILFLSSLFIYFDRDNEKRMYYIIPILMYVFIIVLETSVLRYKEAFGAMYIPIALAFFPLYFFKYYKKYIKGEENLQ